MEKKTFFCSYALIGKDLNLKDNVFFEVNKGIITKIESGHDLKKSADVIFENALLLPDYVNSHIHITDSVAKDCAYGQSLAETVGPKGIKFKEIRKNNSFIETCVEYTFQNLILHGVGTFINFQEGGHPLLQRVISVNKKFLLKGIHLGREKNNWDTLLTIADGLGISTPFGYTDDELARLASVAKKNKKIIGTHVAEDPDIVKKSIETFKKTDLERALDLLKADILVHLTNVTSEEITLIPKDKFLVLCPRSNAFFGLGFPPLADIIEHNFKFGFGTDNIMTTNVDIIEEARYALYQLRVQKKLIDIKTLIKALTVYPAEFLKLNSGWLDTGRDASFIVYDLRHPNFQCSKNLLTSVIFRGKPQSINSHYIQGTKQKIQ